MKTDFSGMVMDIKILNMDELTEKQLNQKLTADFIEVEKRLFKNNQFLYDIKENFNLVKDKKKYKDLLVNNSEILNKHNELLNRYLTGRKEVKPATSELEVLKRKILNLEEEIDLAHQFSGDQMGVYRFFCARCYWSGTSALINAPTKCPGCGSKDHLWSSMLVDGKSNKIKKPYKIKFNPDKNEYHKERSITDIENQLNNLTKAVDAKLKLPTKIKEVKPMVEKELVKICGNKTCGAFGVEKPLEHSKNGTSTGDVHCRFCNQTNYIREK